MEYPPPNSTIQRYSEAIRLSDTTMTKLRLLEDYWSRATFDLENMPELIVDEPKPAGKSLRDYNRTRHALWRPKKISAEYRWQAWYWKGRMEGLPYPI